MWKLSAVLCLSLISLGLWAEEEEGQAPEGQAQESKPAEPEQAAGETSAVQPVEAENEATTEAGAGAKGGMEERPRAAVAPRARASKGTRTQVRAAAGAEEGAEAAAGTAAEGEGEQKAEASVDTGPTVEELAAEIPNYASLDDRIMRDAASAGLEAHAGRIRELVKKQYDGLLDWWRMDFKGALSKFQNTQPSMEVDPKIMDDRNARVKYKQGGDWIYQKSEEDLPKSGDGITDCWVKRGVGKSYQSGTVPGGFEFTSYTVTEWRKFCWDGKAAKWVWGDPEERDKAIAEYATKLSAERAKEEENCRKGPEEGQRNRALSFQKSGKKLSEHEIASGCEALETAYGHELRLRSIDHYLEVIKGPNAGEE